MPSRHIIWTVGHSNHDLGRFAALVCSQGIEYVVDARSYPYSRIAPHFDREDLERAMAKHGIRYVFLGLALGGRPQREDHYDAAGHALYGQMAAAPSLQKAINGLLQGAQEYRLALLCSCGLPHECHRRLLVGRVLCERGAELRHILPDGAIETEQSVSLTDVDHQASLFGHDSQVWRSTRSVSRRRRLSTSSAAS